MPTGVATNRSNITLPADVSREILQKVQTGSAVMTLAKNMPLPGRGAVVHAITSDPTAAWVAETAEKPVSNPGLSSKTMQAYKLAVIMPFSKEFRRDADALYAALVDRLPLALATKFDQTVIGAVEKPGENFDNFAGCTGHAIDGTGVYAYQGLVAAYKDIAEQGGILDGFALSPAAEGILLGAEDGNHRPLFINSVSDGTVARILGAPRALSRGMYKAGSAAAGSSPAVAPIVGVAGDWTQAVYGTVAGVEISISEEATLTVGTEVINLWQRNMFAVRAEIECGFRADTNCFNLLLGAAPTA